MLKITLKIDGMMCGMCESHVNDAIRNSFKVKKVTSSHASGETVIITDGDIADGEIKEAVEKQGYRLLGISREEYVKKGVLSSLFGKNKK